MTVFSLLAVGALAIMNQGTHSAQRALEITQVRQQINAQSEALRYIHQNYIYSIAQDNSSEAGSLSSAWIAIRRATGENEVTTFDNGGASTCKSIPGSAFILDAPAGTLTSVKPRSISQPVPGEVMPPYSQIVYNSTNAVQAAYGIWIEAKRAAVVNNLSYIDFHVRACWENPGSGPAMTLGTIVRLYDPRP